MHLQRAAGGRHSGGQLRCSGRAGLLHPRRVRGCNCNTAARPPLLTSAACCSAFTSPRITHLPQGPGGGRLSPGSGRFGGGGEPQDAHCPRGCIWCGGNNEADTSGADGPTAQQASGPEAQQGIGIAASTPFGCSCSSAAVSSRTPGLLAIDSQPSVSRLAVPAQLAVQGSGRTTWLPRCPRARRPRA